MNKSLIFILLVIVTMQTNAQIIITGAMRQTTDDQFGGGTEYIQLMATETITFGPSSTYCVIIGRNSLGGKVTGWTAPTSYQFNLTEEITVNKGEFFYVGGSERILRRTANGSGPSMAASKWGRFKSINAESGDNGQGKIITSGLMPAAAPAVIGVFNTHKVTNTTKPIDMVVFAGDDTNADYAAYNTKKKNSGYTVPDKNDHYEAKKDKHFRQDGKNMFYFEGKAANNHFYKLTGSYNVAKKDWEKRTVVPVPITKTETIADIETGNVFMLSDQ